MKGNRAENRILGCFLYLLAILCLPCLANAVDVDGKVLSSKGGESVVTLAKTVDIAKGDKIKLSVKEGSETKPVGFYEVVNLDGATLSLKTLSAKTSLKKDMSVVVSEATEKEITLIKEGTTWSGKDASETRVKVKETGAK